MVTGTKDREPTEEQIQWLWEQCGWHKAFLKETPYTDPQGHFQSELPPIDLNNLVRYALPKLMEYYKSQSTPGYLQTANYLMESWISDWVDSDNGYDPALALFEVVYEALGGK